MKVLNISNNGTIKFKMSDGRLGYSYKSSYVRVSLKHNNKKLYQINTKRTNYNAKRSNYYYTRELIYNEIERLRLLYTFDRNNCQNPEWVLTKNI